MLEQDAWSTKTDLDQISSPEEAILILRRVLVSYSQPIRFDRGSVNRCQTRLQVAILGADQ